MKILLPFKSVPEDYGEIGATAASSGANLIINPFDQIAIEQALQLREQGVAEEAVAVTVGPPHHDEAIRAAYAMGCDRAMRVDDDRPNDPFSIARILRAVVERERPDMVLMGKQAVDDDAAQVGPMLAGLLGWPQATFVSDLELSDDRLTARCTRETDAGLERVAVRLPAVITTDLRLNEPRYVSMPGLIRARRKPIDVLSPVDLDLAVGPMTRIVAVNTPAPRPPGVAVGSVEELIEKLTHEAQIF